MDTCCGLHAHIYKNVIFFQGLFPVLSDNTERTNSYATFASKFPTLTVMLKVKEMGTLVQALKLSTGRTAHRERRGIALLFLDHGTGRE